MNQRGCDGFNNGAPKGVTVVAVQTAECGHKYIHMLLVLKHSSFRLYDICKFVNVIHVSEEFGAPS